MFDNCTSSYVGPKCSEVAEKLVQIFGWRHTYNVEKLQKNVPGRDTTRISITRPCHGYIKAQIGEKGPESWLTVQNLQTQGGGILDPDDRLSDVVDDREQILASFEDGDGAHHHGGGDGASGSSVGTGSPDIFHDGEHKYGPGYSRTDIEVTGEHLANGVGGVLQVRRGSEPALNQLPVGPPPPTEHTKRWSAAPLILEPPNIGEYLNISTDWADDSREEDDQKPEFKRMARDGSNRLSMQFLGEGNGYRWAEAAERAANARIHTSLPRDQKRKEPLGQANNSTSPISTLDKCERGELIVIRNEPGPLGIHVVPDYDRQGKDKGLLVQGIEPGGRIDRDGRLAIFDRIVEINGHNLLNLPFQRVQELFKLSLTSPELRLRILKANALDNFIKPPPPVYPKLPEDKENIEKIVLGEQKDCDLFPVNNTHTKIATVSPTKKVPSTARNLKTTNTRKIGRKIELELKKGPHGLGFSITTRDNPASGNCPIYIKNIIPKGAAVEDGRLKIGDRLLEVNGVEMTGKSQTEAVSVLRQAPTGSNVQIVISRQEDVISLPRVLGVDPIAERCENHDEVREEIITPPTIPPLPQNHHRQQSQDKASNVAKIISQFQEAAIVNTPPEKSDDNLSLPWKHKDLVTLNIPVHDSEKAGLGISVKGKTSGNQDLGIFIKSVIHGGAASRDKRLRTNDQLLNVNGISLLSQSNSDAMETLRKAMCHTEGPVPGNITLTIARRAPSPGLNRSYGNKSLDNSLLNTSGGTEIYGQLSNDSDPSSLTDNSGGSTNTVIYNQPRAPIDFNKLQNQNLSPLMNTWNPVLDRLMGNHKQLRNESYYKATNDSWNQSMFSPNQTMLSTTVNLPSGEPILIEDEYSSRVMQQQSRFEVRSIHANQNRNKILPPPLNLPNVKSNNKSEIEVNSNQSQSVSNSSANESREKTIEGSQTTDATYASQLSLENPAGFSRDAFGRQSMSEKRHATLDAKNTDTYQRTKKMREERDKLRGKETNLVRVGSVESVISVNRSSEHPEYADKLGQLGPSLGMKKSSSLESLQTMVQEIQMQEEGDPAYSYRGPCGALKVIRGKGCEESFRAAVDKDYNNHIDPNHRSETGAKKHWLLDPPIDYEREVDGFSNSRGGPRQSSLNAALDSKHKSSRKKPSLLKGIGSMFRFGKHRKIDYPIETQHYQATEFDSGDNVQSKQGEQSEQKQDNMNVQNTNNNPENKMVELQNQQQPPQILQSHPSREPIYQRHGFVHHHAEQVQVIPENSVAPPPIRYRNNNNQISEAHRSNLMKAHEQRMAARHSYYPLDEREPHYEQINRQRMDPNGVYTEYGRPGSRSGITESVPFTHYVNYNELQSRISPSESLSDSQIVQMRLQVQQQRLKVEEESRKQHQYHSQRQTRQDTQLRPVSNFYEYESVQSILNTRGMPPNQPLVQQQQQQQPYQENSSLGRQQQRYVNNRNFHQQQGRGPFVTQVTIGDTAGQKNGTKV